MINSILQKVKNNKAILLYFKNDKCAPCKALRTKIQKLVEQKFPQMKFEIVNSIEQPELTQTFNVYSNPTILVFFQGKEFIRKSAYISLPALEQEMNRLYQLAMN